MYNEQSKANYHKKPYQSSLFPFVLAAVVVAITVGAIIAHRHWAYQQQLELNAVRIANERTATHEMSVQDSLRLHQISTSVEKRGQISDKDFNWMLGVAQSPLPGSDAEEQTLLRSDVFLYINQARVLSDTQKEKLLIFGFPLLKSRQALDRITGLKIVVIAKGKSALPYIQPLLTDTDDAVRMRAQEAINQLSRHG